jgi:hypothetical protein
MVPIPAAIMKAFPSSTPFQRNPIFTQEKTFVCTGFAVRGGYGENLLVKSG